MQKSHEARLCPMVNGGSRKPEQKNNQTIVLKQNILYLYGEKNNG